MSEAIKDTKLMREGLTFGIKMHQLFEDIDKTGGWPVGYKYAGFEHTDERCVGFHNVPRNTGWWTMLASANDYYMWKLEPEYLQAFIDEVVSQVRVQDVPLSRVRFGGYCGQLSSLPKITPQ